MDTVIIGIHGLRIKPPRYLLASWWKKSIIEGFGTIRLSPPHFGFEMAYWAQYMHPKALNPAVKDPQNPYYLYEPYLTGTSFGPRDRDPLRKRLSSGIHREIAQLIAGPSGFMNIGAVSDIILHRMFEELEVYYHKRLRDPYKRLRPARELIRDELARLIRKHRDKSILLIAHSMGAIVAYDVLLHTVPDIPIHTFMTLGAPLGFPVIMKKIRHELGISSRSTQRLPTPESVQRRWLNFSDPDDVTCLNYNLRNFYAENAHGVRPFDQIVYNNYQWGEHPNPHKSYGYLRTAEVARAINQFLVFDNAGFWQRLKWVFSRPEI